MYNSQFTHRTGIMLPSLMMACLYTLVGIFLHEILDSVSPSIYFFSIMYSSQSRLNGIYFVFGVIFHYCFIVLLRSFQLRPLEALLVGHCALLIQPHIKCCCFFQYHLSGIDNAPDIYFLPHSQNQQFLQGTCILFTGEWYY